MRNRGTAARANETFERNIIERGEGGPRGLRIFVAECTGGGEQKNDIIKSKEAARAKEVARARRYPRGARAGLSAEGSLCESEKVYGRSFGDFLPFLKANRCGSEASVHEVDQQLRRNFRHELEQKLSPNFRHELHQKYSNPVFPSRITPAVTSEFP